MGNAASDLEGSGFVSHDLGSDQISSINAGNKKLADIISKKGKAASQKMSILLLGSGESGKTTVLKQMNLIHGGGYTDDTKKQLASCIRFNVIEGLFSIIQSFGQFNFVPDENQQKAVDKVSQFYNELNGANAEFDENIVDAILVLLKAEGFEDKFKGYEIDIQDGWWSFAKSMLEYPKWGGPDWIPSDKDILRSRVRTTGVSNTSFKTKQAEVLITDVGGQRCERKKWMKLFSGVNCVIYLASMSEYNRKLFEDRSTDRLTESVQLWEKTVNDNKFASTPFIVFLNKFDLFQLKYRTHKVPINYSGEYVTNLGQNPPKQEDEKDDNCEKAILWFKGLYMYHTKPEKQPGVFFHVTTALDSDHMKKVMDGCMTHVLRENMQNAGLM